MEINYNKLFARKRVILFFFFLVEIDNIFLKRISLSNHLNEIKDVREKGMTEESLLFEEKREIDPSMQSNIPRNISRNISRKLDMNRIGIAIN